MGYRARTIHLLRDVVNGNLTGLTKQGLSLCCATRNVKLGLPGTEGQMSTRVLYAGTFPIGQGPEQFAVLRTVSLKQAAPDYLKAPATLSLEVPVL